MTALDHAINVCTARLSLRSFRDDDAEPLYSLFANWEVIRWLDSPPWPYAPDDARDYIAARKHNTPDCITAAIALDDRLIGGIDAVFTAAGRHQRGPGHAVGYWLAQPCWGKGYMSEAARGFLAYVFDSIPDDAIYSGAYSENAASLRVQEKLGFVHDGQAQLFSRPLGKAVPHINTVLTRTRFAAASR
jgi:RimJ/RimL family protein N-acetyltransferase